MKEKLDGVLLFGYVSIIVFGVLCLLPFLAMISISLSNEAAILEKGYNLLPVKATFRAYSTLFATANSIFRGYGVSLLVTSTGAVGSTLLMAMCAYALAHKAFRIKRAISFYIYITMLFSGGLLPTYIVISNYYRLNGSLLALILPVLIAPYFIFMLRTYLQGISFEIVESAKIDGANELTICFRIMLPMAVPALAAVFLLRIFFYWNDWFQAMLFIQDKNLWPIQWWMYQVMRNVSWIIQNMSRSGILQQQVNSLDLPVESLRMAMAVVAAGPVIFVFLFLQKFFVKGITVGAVKG